MRTVIVVGGGAVGLCVAEALLANGAEVTVLEAEHCGAGASSGNAGWVTPSLSIPVPGPGVITQSLRWLVDPSGPLWIRPTLSPAMLGWVAQFVRSCSARAHRRGLRVLQTAAAQAGAAFDRLAARGVEFELHREPLLYPAFEEHEREQLLALANQLPGAGGDAPRSVTAAELRALEPALGDGVLGGLIADGERTVRPESFVSAVKQALGGRGAEVLEHSPVLALRRERGRWFAHTSGAVHRGDDLVVAGGVATPALLTPLGVRLPVIAAKGYSRTYGRVASGPSRPIYLEGPKVAISVFNASVRVSGTLELGARDLSLSTRRLTAITTAAQRAMPGWQMPAAPTDWAGMRSLSPDGLPFIGAVEGIDGLYVATAHATLGITLAPLGGQLLADLIIGLGADPLLGAFDPARAARRARPLQTRRTRPLQPLQEDSR